MKTRLLYPAALATLLLTAGCVSTGLSPRERAQVTYPVYILNLQPKASPTEPQRIATPLRLAVVQVGEVAPPRAILDKLQSSNSLISSVIGLPSAAQPPRQQKENVQVTPKDVNALCQLAVSLGADYLFIYGGSMDSWSEGTIMRALDITCVGAAVVPSTKIFIEGKAAGALIHAATAEPVLLASTDAKTRTRATSMLAREKDETLRANLRDELTCALADEFLKNLAAQKALASNSPTPQ